MSKRVGQVWRLRQRPQGPLKAGDLVLGEQVVDDLKPDEVVLRTIFLSLDPTNRIWMSDVDQYLPPVEIGQPMRGVTLGVVEESTSVRFRPGDFVSPHEGTWSTYQVVPAARLSRVRAASDLPLSAYMSVLGPPGLTAYVGMLDIGQARAGQTVTISAAAGAVGSVAGQIAKARGCRVIGIAGGDEKCRWLTSDLSFDGAVDYKKGQVGEQVRALCPDGIDVHFENVGGAILDAVIPSMRIGGRIALCGMISTYNDEGPVLGPREFQRVLMQRLTIQGFIIMDHFARAREAYAEIEAMIRDGRLKWKDHVVEGLEHAADAVNLLFTGQNDGKLMVRVSAP